jgi:hypothetical protein
VFQVYPIKLQLAIQKHALKKITVAIAISSKKREFLKNICQPNKL